MFVKIRTKGHKNVSSMHKSTFEITKDLEIGPTADCIIGVAMGNSMNDFSDEFQGYSLLKAYSPLSPKLSASHFVEL